MPTEATTAKNRRALNLLELVLELEPALRGAYLESIGRQDPELKLQILALLRALGGQQEAEGDATRAEARLSSSEMPQRVGPYKIVREIGRGGMSRVYLAERADQEFERQVALKVIDQGLEAPIVHQRFLAERQILASFDCPQIAKLFDGGTLPNGRPYLLMELVDGVRADQYCAERQLSLEERLRLLRKICGAVSYAHQKLVVHRDLKPSNILVTKEGEPKLLDFGIAKLLDPESFPLRLEEATRSHFRPMTPSHASPEQLLGEPITTSTDIYALGVLLFQLLTGAVPHPQQDRLQKVLRERTGDEVPPKPSESLESADAEKTWSGQDRRRLARRLRGDLDNIVAKALRPLPADRYSSVAELEEDLRRYLEGEPVRATRETPLYLAGKFLRRYRLPVAVAATVLVLVTSFAVVTKRQAQRIAEERDRANEIRGFLTNLIGSADTQSRRSGSVSLKELLDENFALLKVKPFQDSQSQYQLFELIGDGYSSLELYGRAVDAYLQAMLNPNQSDTERINLLLKVGGAAAGSGRLKESEAALQSVMEASTGTNKAKLIRTLILLANTRTTSGDFLSAGHFARSALNGLNLINFDSELPLLAEALNLRLSVLFTLSSDPIQIQRAIEDLLAVLTRSEVDILNLEAVSRAIAYQGNDAVALSVFRFSFALKYEAHEYGVGRTRTSEQFSESLFRLGRIDDARRANALSLVSARKMLALDPGSTRSRYHVASGETREAGILQALGMFDEAAASLRSATATLEPMSRETEIIFAKSTLARAYILAGRLDEARSLMKLLVDKGWRRADLLRLAAQKGLLPDPMPPPLDLDLSLPPKVRAYVDSLPHGPPPWQTATNLPTIEEILVAEEKRLGIVAGSQF
jgi:eukaryotic-like serine/threonine-protein kinase